MTLENNLKESLKMVQSRIQQAMKNRTDDLQYIEPLLVAVSKTKPVEMIIEAYGEGQRHFGENYPQELIVKATDKRILENCGDIKWHFIGHLQSNKVSKVVALPNLFVIETVDSKKLASAVNEACAKHNKQLNIFVQVNTSLEEEKSGVTPEECILLSKYVTEECSHLRFLGLMTIGKFGHNLLEGPNPDFFTLIKCKEKVCQELDLSPKDVQLSMGMSEDFEHAIELGSNVVRVGRSIFGFRDMKI